MTAEIPKPTQERSADVHDHIGAVIGNQYLGPPNEELEAVPMPDNYTSISIGITQMHEVEDQWAKEPGKLVERRGVGGFEDVVGEPLGVGFYYNTAGSIDQLALTFSLSPNPAIAEKLADGSRDPAKMISEFREGQVLEGMKILDLGCGKSPSFALAAKAMGAEVYTADAQDLAPEVKKQLYGHVIVDFNNPDAAAEIEGATGGQFDIVTENMIDAVPLSGPKVDLPDRDTVERISNPLLKEGGHAFLMTDKTHTLLQKLEQTHVS